MDIENGMDSVYLKGLYLGRSIKNNSLNKSNLATNNDNATNPILKKNKSKLKQLAERLLEKEVIFKDDLFNILGERPFKKKNEEIDLDSKDIKVAIN